VRGREKKRKEELGFCISGNVTLGNFGVKSIKPVIVFRMLGRI
jgi:hypothetical protein